MIDTKSTGAAKKSVGAFSSYQKFVVAVLAFLQFTIVLDFMLLAPLGALIIPTLKITPSQFGWVVSAYAFSAGLSGLLTAGFADRFDRKKLLLFFYSGFVAGTLLCGLASNYHWLLLARMVTGLFAGVVGSVSFAIVTDLFPLEMRGRVMGVLQTAFAASSVLGIPLALVLSTRWGWNTPFFMIVVVAALVGGLIQAFLRPVNEHLKHHPDRSPLHHLIQTVSNRLHLQGFATTGLLSVGGARSLPAIGRECTERGKALGAPDGNDGLRCRRRPGENVLAHSSAQHFVHGRVDADDDDVHGRIGRDQLEHFEPTLRRRLMHDERAVVHGICQTHVVRQMRPQLRLRLFREIGHDHSVSIGRFAHERRDTAGIGVEHAARAGRERQFGEEVRKFEKLIGIPHPNDAILAQQSADLCVGAPQGVRYGIPSFESLAPWRPSSEARSACHAAEHVRVQPAAWRSTGNLRGTGRWRPRPRPS
jgi:hypothetical protein